MSTPRSNSCSALARAAGEALYGTVPSSRAWLLIEQPGSWAADPMATEGLAGALADELTNRSKELGFRMLLVRRSAARTGQTGRYCFLARATQQGSWIRRLTIGAPDELLDVDLGVLTSDQPPEVGEAFSSLYTVCTHGKRDPCCAEYGRRLVRRLLQIEDPQLDEHVWESSHQGGHRFAANLACFPAGVFYGQVEPEEVESLLALHEAGSIDLDHYRGRSCLSRPAQAGDYLLRSRLGLTGLDDLRLVSETPRGPDLVELVFAAPDGPHTIGVRIEEGPERRESCNKDKLTPLTRYELLSPAG